MLKNLDKIINNKFNHFSRNITVISRSNCITDLYEKPIKLNSLNNSIGINLRNSKKIIPEVKVENIILDFSGTCVDAFTLAPASAFIDVFKKYKIDICIENAVKKPMGLYKYDHIKYILNMNDVKNQWYREYNRDIKEYDINNIYNDFIKLQVEILPKYCIPLPKVVETMNFLRNTGIKFGGCSGFNREMIDKILDNTKDKGLYFDSTFLADDIKDKNKHYLGGRPYPYMIYENLFNLDNKNIASVIKVDDSIIGIEEGNNAGCWTVGICNYSNYINVNTLEEYNKMSDSEKFEKKEYSKNKFKNESNADYIIGEFDELIAVVDDINKRLKNGEKL